MITGTPQGTLNHWRHEAGKLPVPQIEGERCISPGNVFFQVRAGDDGHGRPLLAWEVTDPYWQSLGIFCRITSLPLP